MRSHLWLLAAVMPLSACSTSSTSAGNAADAPTVQADTSAAARCNEAVLETLVGQTASQAVVDKAVRDTGAKHARVVKPGMAVTMDFREDRLTLQVDDANRIEGASCG